MMVIVNRRCDYNLDVIYDVHMVLCRDCFFFFKQKTAYEMRISDWSSDVCSSDLQGPAVGRCLTQALGPEEAVHFLEILVELLADAAVDAAHDLEIGRASCRERVCQYV